MTKPRLLSIHGSSILLDSNEGLLLGVDSGSRRLGVLLESGAEILLGSSREVSLLQIVAGTLNQRLGLGSVVTHILLGDLGGLLGVLLRDGAELGSLGVDDLAGMLELAVNELLVGGVDERGEEDDGCGNHGKTPVGNDLDQVVRDEGTESRL